MILKISCVSAVADCSYLLSKMKHMLVQFAESRYYIVECFDNVMTKFIVNYRRTTKS